MPKFRKKPVVIDAWQFTGQEVPAMVMSHLKRGDAPVWIDRACERGTIYKYGQDTMIKTLEGDMKVSEGDWIIRGVQGELYPCKDEIFRQTYDKADSSDGKHNLTFETATGERSGVAFREVDPSGSPETFLFSLGCALTALYRHQHEKRMGCPPAPGLFSPRYTLGSDPTEIDDPTMQSIIEAERAAKAYYESLKTFIDAKISQRGAEQCDGGCSGCGSD